jgi:hypothetical protein
LLQACAESKKVEHLKCLQGCRKECAQRDLFSKRLRSCEESSGGREAFRIIERLHRRFSCQEIPKGKEIDGQDLTEEIDKPVSRWISWRCEEVTTTPEPKLERLLSHWISK